MYKIIHNPRCRKSREALKILHEKKIKIQVLEYLKEPLTKNQFTEIISLLSDYDIERVLRKNELVYKEKYKNKVLNKEELVDAIYNHPILIERPIVFNEKVAIIARPAENILDLLKQ
ncbi:MAG: arsenate reductase [Flavobacteriales bacterium]|nr:arsenate reductase [Flavobacteriales bacterium]|tara:strand:- start:28518 stop:28868 length:351 start_codon:yes stop_codon:yes gene_type:complete